jgi:TolA-binding protein
MSDALIHSLQKRIDDLTGENASLKSENISRRKALKETKSAFEKLQAEHGQATKERDDYKGKAEAGPTELTSKIADLEGKLRSRDHRDAFSAVKDFEVLGQDGNPSKFKLREGVTIEALMKLTDYKAEGETPDAKAVTTRLGDAMKANPGLFEAAGETPTHAPGGASRYPVGPREAGPVGSGARANDTPPARDADGWLASQKATRRPGVPFGKIG